MIRMPRAIAQEIIAHCQRLYPKEACGLLAAALPPPAGQAAQVVAAYAMRNVEDSPIGYAMDPLEQLRMERQMRASRQRLLGIYHSHTASEAYPSPVDVRLAISPDISYVLVSLADRAHPVLNSYRIDGDRILPEEAIIDDGHG